MRGHRVPLRKSLVVRLLATSILVAVCATVTTAWLVVQSTTQAVRQEQGRALSDDTSVYDTLVGYAATHADWSRVAATLDERARVLGRRITLTTEDRQVIADSADGPSLRTARPSATVDPLRVDPALIAGAQRIDPRVVGPYRLPDAERRRLRTAADRRVACLKNEGVGSRVADQVTGRPVVRELGGDAEVDSASCWSATLSDATPTEHRALAQLETATLTCMHSNNQLAKLYISPSFTVLFGENGTSVLSAARAKQLSACVLRARQAQLRPYVAPPALLFVTDPAAGAAQPMFNLSRPNLIRIAVVTGGVLLLAILITVLVGSRLVRPLRALAEAASSARPMPVTTDDEIGHLAVALNDLAARRDQVERQRKAMVSDVAHELRTPLTNMRSWLEAAQDGLAPADPQLLGLLLEEAVLLQHVLDDLRDLAAADAGNLRVHPEPVYVNDALEQVADAHRGSGTVRLATEADGDPQVVVDPVRLRQLVGNLVSNAVRHSPPGGTVTIRSRVAAGHLTIEVTDTGDGIAAADLPKVFDRFWRADGSRSRSTGGSGLGLAIARRLAEAHGGTIAVASTPGVLTTFTVRMPAELIEAQQVVSNGSSGT